MNLRQKLIATSIELPDWLKEYTIDDECQFKMDVYKNVTDNASFPNIYIVNTCLNIIARLTIIQLDGDYYPGYYIISDNSQIININKFKINNKMKTLRDLDLLFHNFIIAHYNKDNNNKHICYISSETEQKTVNYIKKVLLNESTKK